MKNNSIQFFFFGNSQFNTSKNEYEVVFSIFKYPIMKIKLKKGRHRLIDTRNRKSCKHWIYIEQLNNLSVQSIYLLLPNFSRLCIIFSFLVRDDIFIEHRTIQPFILFNLFINIYDYERHLQRLKLSRYTI